MVGIKLWCCYDMNKMKLRLYMVYEVNCSIMCDMFYELVALEYIVMVWLFYELIALEYIVAGRGWGRLYIKKGIHPTIHFINHIQS